MTTEKLKYCQPCNIWWNKTTRTGMPPGYRTEREWCPICRQAETKEKRMKRLSDEQKKAAVEDFKASGEPAKTVAKRHNTTGTSLMKWVKAEYFNRPARQAPVAPAPQPEAPAPAPAPTPEPQQPQVIPVRVELTLAVRIEVSHD